MLWWVTDTSRGGAPAALASRLERISNQELAWTRSQNHMSKERKNHCFQQHQEAKLQEEEQTLLSLYQNSQDSFIYHFFCSIPLYNLSNPLS